MPALKGLTFRAGDSHTNRQSWASVLRSATLMGRHRAADPTAWGWGFRYGLLEPPGSFLSLQEMGPQKGQED